jgi:RNA:NAD 2'-phosphotransferase (TPT1/KptA family)
MFRERLSHALTKVLRHTANAEGIAVGADGFCPVRELLELQVFKALSCSVADIVDVVESSKKKRFQLSEKTGELMLRAAQGHSMTNVEDALGLESLTDLALLPEVCVHGTYTRNVSSILERGLLAGGLPGASKRKHVHFQPLEPGDPRVISGMRADCDAAIYIDLRAALRDGVPFFRSTNNVILSAGIEGVIAAKYIVNVVTKIVPPPWLPSRPVKQERGTAQALDGMKQHMGSIVASEIFQCFAGRIDVRALDLVKQCVDNSETVMAYPVCDWTEPRHQDRVSLDTPLRVHKISADGDFWLCSQCCSIQRRMAWVPRDVMLIWQVREHCFQPDRGWQGSDRFLSLSIDDMVVVRKRYSCGWEGWASGRTWGMRKEADGAFPVTVVVPMVLIHCV